MTVRQSLKLLTCHQWNSLVKPRFLQTFSTSSSITSSWQSENVKEDGEQTLQMTEPRKPEPLPSSRICLHTVHTVTHHE